MNIGIVMGRSRSTRLPDKNISGAGSLPLFAHAKQTLAQSDICNRILFATDSKRYAQLAESYGFDDIIMRKAEWDWNPHNMENAIEMTLHTYEQKERFETDLCAFIGANVLFVRPSWFTAAALIIRYYVYNMYPVHLVTSEVSNVPMGVFRAHTTRAHPKVFELKNRSIICDIDYPMDIQNANEIARAIEDGHIDYTDESYHVTILKDHAERLGLTPNNDYVYL